MKKLLICLVCSFAVGTVTGLEVEPLSFDAAGLRDAFNASQAWPRLVGVFSPSCGHCLKACSELQEILNKYPDARVKVFLLWAPYGPRDNRRLAQWAATSYLSDERVHHFWDLWRFGSRIYAPQLKLPAEHAWDMFTFYKPHLVWRETLPEPTFWMQNRNLDIGVPYTQDDLEKELKQWLE